MNYYALLVALVLVTGLFMRGYQQKNKKYVIVACLLLFAIYGLRNTYYLGSDSKSSYLGNFWRMQSFSWAEVIKYANGKNDLFFLFTKFYCEYISDDYQLYVSLIAVFVTVCFGRMVYRYSPNPLQSILYHFGLLYFTFHFSAFKQSIAMAILMLAFDQVIERKPVKFFLLVLIAGQFHFPALVFLPAYWIPNIKLGRSFIIVISVLLVITYVFRNQILYFMNSLYREEAEEVDLSDVQFLRTKALIMVVIVVVSAVFRVPTGEDRLYETLLVFMGVAIVFQTFCGYDNTFERLADYYFQFSVIFLPMVFDKHAERKSLLSWRFMEVADTVAPYLFCGFGIYRFLTFVVNDPSLYPFYFYFQHK